MTPVRISLWVEAEMVSTEVRLIDGSEAAEVLSLLNLHRLAGQLHMIELEFLDEPNARERFLRFGSDPRGMVRPVQIAGHCHMFHDQVADVPQ